MSQATVTQRTNRAARAANIARNGGIVQLAAGGFVTVDVETGSALGHMFQSSMKIVLFLNAALATLPAVSVDVSIFDEDRFVLELYPPRHRHPFYEVSIFDEDRFVLERRHHYTALESHTYAQNRAGRFSWVTMTLFCLRE